MKRKNLLPFTTVLFSSVTLGLSSLTYAASYQWDANSTVSPDPAGGTGVWDANASANWWDGTANVVWPALGGTDDDAVFGATAGTVSLATGGITVNDITFNTTGYLIQSNTLTLNGTSSVITTAPAVTATISSALAGTANINKAGSGVLILSGANSAFTGKTSISEGALSIASDAALGAAPVVAVADQLTLNGGELRITVAGQTLHANRGITLGSSGGTIDASTIATTGATTTIAGVITGTGPLTLKSTGNLTAAGGGDGGLGIKLNQATNTFVGDVTITAGLVSYAHNLSFGDAANKIVLNGGGLLDNNLNIALARDIQVLAGGGTFRTYGSVNVTWSGAITGSGAINRTDGGTLTHSGDLSGYSGTYNVQAGTTQLTGTAATIGGNWTVASGTSLTINSSSAQALNGSISGAGSLNINSSAALTLGGATSMTGSLTVNGLATWGSGASVNMGVGNFNINGTGIATIGNGATLNADNINLTGTTSNQLNILAGATVTTKYFNIGNSGSNSGRINQTGGLVTIASGGTGMRIGHWNNSSNAGSLYHLSGGILDATAISQINIGHDGQGDMIVGGALGSAVLKVARIQLDNNGDGGGNTGGNMTLTMSTNGTAEIGAGGIGAAGAGDQVILNGGTLKATAVSTWGANMTSNASTTSVFDANGLNVTMTGNIAGTGVVDLSAASGAVQFSTTGVQSISAPLSGVSIINKIGTGTTTLSGVGSTHNGVINVNDGRLDYAGSGVSSLVVAATKALGGEGTTTGSLTMNGGFLQIDPTTGTELTLGALALTGTNALRFEIMPSVAGGAFDVLTYTGALTGAINTNLVLENASSYRNSTLVDTSGVVTLDIQSKNLTWNGTSGGQWDVLTSARWNASEVDQFAWGDSVAFDDTGLETSLTLAGELRPSAIAVSGTKNYTISGAAGNFIAGLGGLNKSGSSTLLLNAPNTYSGANVISAGTVQVGDGTNNIATLGTGATSIASGASLVYYRNGAYTLPQTITGAGVLAFRGTGVSGQSDYGIGGNNSAFSGILQVRSGARVQLDSANDVGTSSIVVDSGGQIYLSAGVSYANAVTLNGIGWTEVAGNLGAVRFQNGATLAGAVTLAGNTRLTALASGDTGSISGIISDGAFTFGLTKTGAGALTLTNANTYDGATTISAGTINIRNAASLGTAAVTLGDAASGSNAMALYLDTNRVNFARTVTVSSNGTGTVTLGSRATVTGSGDNNQFSNIVLQRNVTFDSNAADRTDYENISGTGNITVAGAGRSIFMTNNTYVGNLTINTSADANGLQLGTVSTAFNALYDLGSVQIDTGGKLSLSYSANGSETIGSLNGAGTVRQNGGGLNTLIFGNGNGTGSFSGTIVNGTGTIAITKVGTGTQTLSGANTQTGATGINGGTLALDFATQNNSKLSDTAALNFGLGTSTLSLAGGSHTEVVASTSLAAGASANITRSTGTSVLQLGTITVGANSALNLGTASIATTNNLNNASGMLGAWATVGNNWAQSAASGTNIPITAFASYVDYTRLSSGTKVIANNATDNARIVDGTSTAGNITLAAATTNINTLNQTATGGATTMQLSGTNNTLRLGTAGGILAGPGVSALTIGSAVNEGFLSAGGSTTNTAGTLYLTNNSSNTLTINSALINNGTGAVTLVKNGSGLVTLAGNSGATYSGGTFVNQGELRVNAPTTVATYTTLGTGAISVGTGATLRFFTGSTTNAITYANTINLTNATLAHEDGNHTLSGAVSLTGTNTVTGVWGDKNLTMSGVISGTGSLIKTNTAGQATTLTLSNINTYTGGTTVNAGTLRLNNGGANGTIRGTLTVNAGASVTYGANNSFGYNSGGSVNVLNIIGGTAGSAGFGNHFWNNFQLNMTAGTLNLGFNASQTTNDWQSPTITTSAAATTATIAAADANAVMRLRDNTHATFNVADGAAAIDLSIAPAITQSGGVSNITKNGLGLMQIAGVNTYTGTTTINAGTLRISGAGSLNSGNYSSAITNNGVLEFNSTATQTLGGIISGTGSLIKNTGTGTLTLSGNNTFTGATTINAGKLALTGSNATSIVINTGASLASSGSTTGSLTLNAGSTIALNGVTPGSGIVVAGAVAVTGSTAIVLDAPPAALGTVSNLVFGYGSLTGLANLVAPAGYRASVVNDSANSRVLLDITTGTRTWNQTTPGTWDVLSNASWVESDTLFANGDAVVFDNTATNGNITLAGTLTPQSVTFNHSTTSYALSGAGVIAGTTGIVKNGDGTASIATANTYSGATLINQGTLNIQHATALGNTTGSTTVASGATLQIQGGINTVEPISLAGTGFGSNGAITNLSGTNTISGALTLTNHATVVASAGELILSAAAGHSGGPFTLTKNGTGNLRMNAANNAVDITVTEGTLFARGGNFSAAFAPGRTITVDGTGKLDTITHSLGSEVGGGGAVASIGLTNGGTWQANNEQYVRTLTMTSGNVTGAGELRTLSSSVYTSVAAATSSTISAGVNMVNAGSFAVNDGAAADDMVLSGYISNAGAITKTGDGTMVISGTSANTFTGALNINAGIVRVEKSSALGTTAAGTTVASGAALHLANGVAIGAEALSLSGTGPASGGALRNISGTNSFAGAISLAAASRINSDAGSLTLSGNISGTAVNLSIGGAGDTTVSGIIDVTTGGLVKDGAGTLTLSGNNTFTGTTTVSAGTLLVSGALGTSSLSTGTVTVDSGATVGGTGEIYGSIVLNGGSYLSIASLADPLKVTGTVTLGSGFGIDNLLGIDWDSLDLDTKYTLISDTSTTFDTSALDNFGIANKFAVGSLDRFAYFDNGSLAVYVVPETSTAMLGLTGLLGLAWRRRRSA
jgi:autotransporter-associated beta strand protein